MAKIKKVEITVNQARVAISALHEAAEYHGHCADAQMITYLRSTGKGYAEEVQVVPNQNKKTHRMWKRSEKDYLKLKHSLIKKVKKAEEKG